MAREIEVMHERPAQIREQTTGLEGQIVDPTHIDAVHAGQEAVLRMSAFNTRTTPVLARSTAQRLCWARAIAKLEGQQLVAGMPVEVFIQTGEHTAIESLLKPITDYLGRAKREE